MSNRKKVLWLVSWYPNRYDPFDGDFIQRHARAAALYDDITVLFVKMAEAQPVPVKVDNRQESLLERIIYLPKEKGLKGRLSGACRWWKIYCREATEIIRQQRPDFVHVQVPWKAGLVALWLKRKYQLPFLVTEHWGIYNRVVADNIHTRPVLFRYWLRRIYRKADAFISVSRFLAEGVCQAMVPKKYTVLPNVVDTGLFFPSLQKNNRFTFLHVSNMVPVKNVGGLLLAFEQFLTETGSGAQLILVGNRDQEYVQMAARLNLLNWHVFFRGEIPYAEVALEMQQAHVLVLNSDMENSPCVIGEALCCGLPVVATQVGGIPELVTPANSILVPPRDPQALAAALLQMEKSYAEFRPGIIAATARDTFSMAAVGQRLHRIYGEQRAFRAEF